MRIIAGTLGRAIAPHKSLSGSRAGASLPGMSDPVISDSLDTRGLLCPLPVLKARKRLGTMAPGAVLEMLADDPAARVDVPHFCTEQGHRLLAEEEPEPGLLRFVIARG